MKNARSSDVCIVLETSTFKKRHSSAGRQARRPLILIRLSAVFNPAFSATIPDGDSPEFSSGMVAKNARVRKNFAPRTLRAPLEITWIVGEVIRTPATQTKRGIA